MTYSSGHKFWLYMEMSYNEYMRLSHWVLCEILKCSMLQRFIEHFSMLAIGDDSGNGPYASGTLIAKEKAAPLFFIYMSSIIFGATHCLAWHFKFPSEVEKWLWHVSSIVITFTFPSAISYHTIVWVLSWINSQLCYCKHALAKILLWMLKVLFVVLKFLIYIFLQTSLLIHPLARLILLVEMFVVLRNPDSGIYSSVNWVTYIPHF